MRLFQLVGLGRSYRSYFDREYPSHLHSDFIRRRQALIEDRYGSCHLLAPIRKGETSAFLAYGDDPLSQRSWARKHGLRSKDPNAILLAQIEQHRTEVLYSLDPVTFGADLLKRLPGCVRATVCWRAAPIPPSTDFSPWHLRVCNFPAIISAWRRDGLRAGYLPPAHDPEMDAVAANSERPVNVVFVGTWSRHHARRSQALSALVKAVSGGNLRLHLTVSRMSRIASLPGMGLVPIGRHRLPSEIAAHVAPPIYGRALHHAFSTAKIVFNGAIDMAGSERGNMRCFEAMGCGSAMVSDEGSYPEGMLPGVNLATYRDAGDLVKVLDRLLRDESACRELGRRAHAAIVDHYPAERQWRIFQDLVGNID